MNRFEIRVCVCFVDINIVIEGVNNCVSYNKMIVDIGFVLWG